MLLSPIILPIVRVASILLALWGTQCWAAAHTFAAVFTMECKVVPLRASLDLLANEQRFPLQVACSSCRRTEQVWTSVTRQASCVAQTRQVAQLWRRSTSIPSAIQISRSKFRKIISIRSPLSLWKWTQLFKRQLLQIRSRSRQALVLPQIEVANLLSWPSMATLARGTGYSRHSTSAKSQISKTWPIRLWRIVKMTRSQIMAVINYWATRKFL